MHRPYCEVHTQVPAVARCVVCGKYLCPDCLVESASRAYCAACLETERRRLDEERRAAADAAAAGMPTPAPPPGVMPPVQAPGAGGGQPVGARVVVNCAFHPGVRAVTRCSVCGALICAGCQRIVGDRRLCQGCYLSLMQERGVLGPAGAGMKTRKEPSLAAAPWKLWPGLAFLPLPFILSGIMTYMMRRGEEVSVGAAQLLLSLLLYTAMLFFAFIIVSRYGPSFREIGFHSGNLPSSLGLGFIGGAVSFWTAVAAGALSVGLFSGLGWLEEWLRGFFDVNVKNATGTDLLIAGIIIIIAAPICEEIFFRGYLYPAMRGRMGVWGAALLNGFLFSAVHFSLFGLIGRTVAGVIFCILYEYNDNLWSPITAHAMNNFVAFFLPLVYISTR